MSILAQAQLDEALKCMDSLIGGNEYTNSILGTALSSNGDLQVANIIAKLNNACLQNKSVLPSIPKIPDISNMGKNLSKQVFDTIENTANEIKKQVVGNITEQVKAFNKNFYEVSNWGNTLKNSAAEAGTEFKNVFTDASKGANAAMRGAKKDADKDEIKTITDGSIDDAKRNSTKIDDAVSSNSKQTSGNFESIFSSLKAKACYVIGGLNSLLNKGGLDRIIGAIGKLMDKTTAPIDALYNMGQALNKMLNFNGVLPNPANNNPCLALVQDVILNGLPTNLCQIKKKYGQGAFKFGYGTNILDKVLDLLAFIKRVKDKIVNAIKNLLNHLRNLFIKFPLCDKSPINLVKSDLDTIKNLPKEIKEGYSAVMSKHNEVKSGIYFENWVLSTEDHNKVNQAFKFNQQDIDDYNEAMKLIRDMETNKSLDYVNKSDIILNFDSFETKHLLDNVDTQYGQCYEGVGFVPNASRTCVKPTSLLIQDIQLVTAADAYGADYLYGNLIPKKCN